MKKKLSATKTPAKTFLWSAKSFSWLKKKSNSSEKMKDAVPSLEEWSINRPKAVPNP